MKKMETENLKNWIKEWDIETIVGNTVIEGISFMAGKITNKELQNNKKIIIQEIKKRIKE